MVNFPWRTNDNEAPHVASDDSLFADYRGAVFAELFAEIADEDGYVHPADRDYYEDGVFCRLAAEVDVLATYAEDVNRFAFVAQGAL